MDSTKANYDPMANVNSNSWCVDRVSGCMEPLARDYSTTTTVQTTCAYTQACTSDPTAINYVVGLPSTYSSGATCYAAVFGCLDPTANNRGCFDVSQTSPCTLAAPVTIHVDDMCNRGVAATAVSAFFTDNVNAAVTVAQASVTLLETYVASTVSALLTQATAAAAAESSGTASSVLATADISISYSFATGGDPCAVTAAQEASVSATIAATIPAGTFNSVTATVSNTGDCTVTVGATGRRLQAQQIQWAIAIIAPQSTAAAVQTATTTTFASPAALGTVLAADPLLGSVIASVLTIAPVAVTLVFSSPSPPPPASGDSSSSSDDNTGAIIGGVIGGIIGAALIGGLVYFMMKRNSNKSTTVVPA